jgi:hypothetical protein
MEGNWVEMLSLESLQDLANYSEFTEHFQGGLSRNKAQLNVCFYVL